MATIPYNHPRYNDIKRKAEELFDHTFNQVNLQDAEERAEESLIDYIVTPSFPALAREWLGNKGVKELKEIYAEYLNYRDGEEPDEQDSVIDIKRWREIRDKLVEVFDHNNFVDGADDEEEFFEWLEDNYESDVNDYYHDLGWYPMWSTLFESSGLDSDDVDTLYECGIGLIEGFGNYDNMLFISGAGYDFYEAHWIPMFISLGWIELNRYPDPSQKISKCDNCNSSTFTVISEKKYELVGRKLVPVTIEPAELAGIRCSNCGTEYFESNFMEVL